MRSRSSRPVLVGALAVLLAAPLVAGVQAGAIELGGEHLTGASVTERAVRMVPEYADVVSIYDSGALDESTEVRALQAAEDAGAQASVRLVATVGMIRVERGSSTVQAAPSGFSYPMGTTVIERPTVLELMGTDVVAALGEREVVMSTLSASLRGAEAGDVVTLISSDGRWVEYTIGAVVDDAITGGTEILMDPDGAARIGLDRRSSVVIWDFPSREAIDQAMRDNDLVSTRIRIRRSWDPADPDSTIGMARTKSLTGEFAYRVNADGSVTVDDTWRLAYIPKDRELLNPDIPIYARCNVVVRDAIRAALADVAAAGLGHTINVYDANRAGGCYNPRFSRLAASTFGFLSRHSWGVAIDTNTVGGCQGCAPPDFVTNGGCETVRIFRRHGFAWGGNFLTPDGMHFEFVGESRDQLPYASRYCPNVVDGGLVDPDAELPVDQTERPTIFTDAELLDVH